jgi:ribonuclease VapC
VTGRVEFVLDATALIALLSREPGHQKVAEILDRAAVSTVNLAETIHKLVQRGSAPAQAERFLRDLQIRTEEWSEDMAYESAGLAHSSRALGLSLGDRACLTLAKHLGATAVTADRIWRKIPALGVPILIFR